jgi:hypothetical protein
MDIVVKTTLSIIICDFMYFVTVLSVTTVGSGNSWNLFHSERIWKYERLIIKAI